MRANVASYMNADNKDILEDNVIPYDGIINNSHADIGKNCKSANFTFVREDKNHDKMEKG